MKTCNIFVKIWKLEKVEENLENSWKLKKILVEAKVHSKTFCLLEKFIYVCLSKKKFSWYFWYSFAAHYCKCFMVNFWSIWIKEWSLWALWVLWVKGTCWCIIPILDNKCVDYIYRILHRLQVFKTFVKVFG